MSQEDQSRCPSVGVCRPLAESLATARRYGFSVEDFHRPATRRRDERVARVVRAE
jgi:hypothetical protein